MGRRRPAVHAASTGKPLLLPHLRAGCCCCPALEYRLECKEAMLCSLWGTMNMYMLFQAVLYSLETLLCYHKHFSWPIPVVRALLHVLEIVLHNPSLRRYALRLWDCLLCTLCCVLRICSFARIRSKVVHLAYTCCARDLHAHKLTLLDGWDGQTGCWVGSFRRW